MPWKIDVLEVARAVRTIIMGMAAKSWTKDQPIIISPCIVSFSPLSDRSLIITAVDENENPMARTAASRRVNLQAKRMAQHKNETIMI